jgi:hypothetical protein
MYLILLFFYDDFDYFFITILIIFLNLSNNLLTFFIHALILIIFACIAISSIAYLLLFDILNNRLEEVLDSVQIPLIINIFNVKNVHYNKQK